MKSVTDITEICAGFLYTKRINAGICAGVFGKERTG